MLFKMKLWWMSTLMNLLYLEMAKTRGVWIWAGHLGISFQRIPGFSSKLMIKHGERQGIRVFQFGPLIMTWAETH